MDENWAPRHAIGGEKGSKRLDPSPETPRNLDFSCREVDFNRAYASVPYFTRPKEEELRTLAVPSRSLAAGEALAT